ncbi:Monothiol glutaredoxin-S16, chloroplastic [Morella rubra]|uniref:Monothiol glutaredoxin-S16, chloroplastic n=1 Tax=Morella rubra TaxID=262757 RepID=A0A6A1VSV8_9ROSI|nr:Monothiol glutaredoxin-S16, chloroplastic [Morella rubra]
MATINLSSVHTPHSIRFRSSLSTQNASNLSLYSPRKSSLTFPSVSLKSDGAAKIRALTIALSHKNLSETELAQVPPAAEDVSGKLPSDAGVYAIYDKNEELQFIGISRNIAASITVHRKSVPDLCNSVKRVETCGFPNYYIKFNSA